MELSTYFKDFIGNTRLSDETRKKCETAHKDLRDKIKNDPKLSKIILSDFLQGSYRRGTIIRTLGDDKKVDVDVVIVTNLSKDDYPDPQGAFNVFYPFLNKHYAGRCKQQGRSIGINHDEVNLDLVITSDPSEAVVGIMREAFITNSNTPEDMTDSTILKSWTGEKVLSKSAARFDWKKDFLYIPDRDVKKWVPTNPLEQIRWTWGKNFRCHGHYVDVVKSAKWWKQIRKEMPKYPKGYPLEHMIGTFCPDGIGSIAEGFTKAFEGMASNFKVNFESHSVPQLFDHGVPINNVLSRISADDFALFYQEVRETSKIAREALNSEDADNSASLWRRLFGDQFPIPTPPTGGYTPRADVTRTSGGRYG